MNFCSSVSSTQGGGGSGSVTSRFELHGTCCEPTVLPLLPHTRFLCSWWGPPPLLPDVPEGEVTLPPGILLSAAPPISLTLSPQFLELWRCPRRCASWKTTPLLSPSWKSTSSAVPRRALSTTTPSPVTMTDWPRCRRVGPKPATRY